LNAWSSIQYVGTGLGLVAFIVAALILAAVLYAYRARLGHRAEITNSAPIKERLAVIETTAELFGVDLAGQTSEQRQEIVLKQIERRARRELLFGGIALIIAILLAATSVNAIVQSRYEPSAIAQNGPPPEAWPRPPQRDSVKLQRKPITPKVDGVSMVHIVRQIRCETREAVKDRLIAMLERLAQDLPHDKGDPIARKLLTLYTQDPDQISNFSPTLFPGPKYQQVRNYFTTFGNIGVAYDFDFHRFRTTNTLAGLLTKLTTPLGAQRYCDGFIATTNDTGRIGVDKLILEFLQLSLFGNPSGPLVDDFTYIPTPGSTDTHAVRVALAIAPASNVEPLPEGGSPSEALALKAIDEFKGRPTQGGAEMPEHPIEGSISPIALLVGGYAAVMLFLLLILGVVIYVRGAPVPSAAIVIFRVILALSSGAFGWLIGGEIAVNFNVGVVTGNATGALGLAVLVYLVNPPAVVENTIVNQAAPAVNEAAPPQAPPQQMG
jgi:hypothetical protein